MDGETTSLLLGVAEVVEILLPKMTKMAAEEVEVEVVVVTEVLWSVTTVGRKVMGLGIALSQTKGKGEGVVEVEETDHQWSATTVEKKVMDQGIVQTLLIQANQIDHLWNATTAKKWVMVPEIVHNLTKERMVEVVVETDLLWSATTVVKRGMDRGTAPRIQIHQELEVLRLASSASRKATCQESVLMKKFKGTVQAVAEAEEEDLGHASNVEKKDICLENVLLEVEVVVAERDPLWNVTIVKKWDMVQEIAHNLTRGRMEVAVEVGEVVEIATNAVKEVTWLETVQVLQKGSLLKDREGKMEILSEEAQMSLAL